MGHQRGRVPTDHRPVPRARRQLHRHRQLLHPQPFRENHRRPHRPPPGPARPHRDRDQVQRQPVPGRSQRRGLGPQGVDQCLRKLAAPFANRLHRPVLAASLGPEHSDRGDDGRPRRPGAGGQGSLHRCVRHPGVEDRRSQHDCAFPRLVGLCWTADRVLVAGAHGRAGTGTDGERIRPGHHSVVTAEERRAQRQVHPKQRRPAAVRARRAGQ